MGLLLYKSNEMFSATELIRKSKTIFDKVLNKEIEKAIILRDGKPSFLLMEFEKYEKIMAEFEELKEFVATQKEKQPKKIKVKEKKKNKEVEKVEEKIISRTPSIEKTEPEQLIENINQSQKEPMVESEPEKEIEELSEEEEINNAFQSIENMNFDDEMKKEAQDKIRTKILQARRERAELLASQEQEMQKEEEQEQQLRLQIEEEKVKKERELKEFWD